MHAWGCLRVWVEREDKYFDQYDAEKEEQAKPTVDEPVVHVILFEPDESPTQP